ncbi:MAG: 5-formyltetrahydrofolate cyclo-ligase [Cocleimonas sp.]
MKDQLRKKLIKKRSVQPTEAQTKKSDKICHFIHQSDTFINAKNVALYHAVRGEVDLISLRSNTKHQQNKQFFLPVVSLQQDQGLVFAPIHENSKYQQNQFSIPEPVYKEEELIKAEQLDLILMPLLAFDRQGNRLGMGGGYYDRSLAFKQQEKTTPVSIGIAYDFQKVSSLSAEPWDVRLDMVVTESGLHKFR